ncbi:hypothetical protein OUZ56_005558 [Daphnia magna]|uniref:Uncharacterized protein n=1 Tax=Daphnia magna TaxID=35525 RepID=A0ABQ9YTB4_9CRUS|nr:hypothetical protein OUZ56_005558 [Daphnia magna]
MGSNECLLFRTLCFGIIEFFIQPMLIGFLTLSHIDSDSLSYSGYVDVVEAAFAFSYTSELKNFHVVFIGSIKVIPTLLN